MGANPPSLGALRAILLARGIVLGAPIGSGAAATVYAGEDERHQRRVAIKVLDPLADTAVISERFTREIGLVAGFHHPHILPMYDSGEVEGLRYYIMPFAVGESLRGRLLREGPLPPDQAIRLGVEIADALSYAHQRGVVHRDVKPANILLEGDHFILADFGIAAVSPRAERPALIPAALTRQGHFVGTLEYMAPEQILGEAVDGRADLYALASVIFEALSGQLPFVANSPAEVAQRKLAGAHEPLDRLVSGLPLGLSMLMDRALAPDRSNRLQSIDEFRMTLGEFRTSASGALVRRRQGSRMSGRWRLLGGAVVIVGVAALWWQLSPPSLDPRRVVVAGFSNETGNPDLVAFGDQVETWITDSLAHLESILVISAAVDLPIRRPQGLGGPETPPERLATLAKETRAGTVVAGSFFESGSQLQVSVEVTDARSGEIRSAVGPVIGTLAEKDQLVATVGRLVVRAVDSVIAQRRPIPSKVSGRSASDSKLPPR